MNGRLRTFVADPVKRGFQTHVLSFRVDRFNVNCHLVVGIVLIPTKFLAGQRDFVRFRRVEGEVGHVVGLVLRAAGVSRAGATLSSSSRSPAPVPSPPPPLLPLSRLLSASEPRRMLELISSDDP